MAKPKLQSYPKLKKDLDAIFSKYIRQRDGFVCFTCGKRGDMASMQNGHYVSRVYLATRWDERNCHAQCPACNIFKHGNMTAYACRMASKYGMAVLEEMEMKKNQTMKVSTIWLISMIQQYKSLVK